MPLAALEHGTDWEWETFAEYLDRLDGQHRRERRLPRRPLRHPPLRDGRRRDRQRCHAGADRAHAGRAGARPSRPAPSASRSPTRPRTATVTASPSPAGGRRPTRCSPLCEETGKHAGTTLEGIVPGCLDQFADDEIELLAQMSAVADRPLNWNVLTVDSREPERVPRQLEASDRADRARRPGGGAHDAGAGADEHELPQLLRALADPRLAGGPRRARARAHRAPARPRHAAAGCTSCRSRRRPACSAASPTGATT